MAFLYFAFSKILNERSGSRHHQRCLVKFGHAKDVAERLDRLNGGWKLRGGLRSPALAGVSDWQIIAQWPGDPSCARRDKPINRFLREATPSVMITTAIEAELKAADPTVNLNGLTEIRCIDPTQAASLAKAAEAYGEDRVQIVDPLTFALSFVARAERA